MFQNLKNFIQESRQELKKVNWPSKEETARYTMFVIGFSLVLASFLGLLDFGFLKGLQNLILK